MNKLHQVIVAAIRKLFHLHDWRIVNREILYKPCAENSRLTARTTYTLAVCDCGKKHKFIEREFVSNYRQAWSGKKDQKRG